MLQKNLKEGAKIKTGLCLLNNLEYFSSSCDKLLCDSKEPMATEDFQFIGFADDEAAGCVVKRVSTGELLVADSGLEVVTAFEAMTVDKLEVGDVIKVWSKIYTVEKVTATRANYGYARVSQKGFCKHKYITLSGLVAASRL